MTDHVPDVEQVVREYIDKTLHMSLATASNDMPWVCEVHFAYDDDLNLYFRSLFSTRHSQEIAANPRVAGNIIDKYNLGDPVIGVYFEGTGELLTAETELEKAFEVLHKRINIPAEALEEARQDDGAHKFYKISVKNWYVFGRFGGPSGQKYTLEWNNQST